MKCPHCARDSKAFVTETRAAESGVYRRRHCGHCGQFFVTVESAPAGLKMPDRRGQRLRPPANRLRADTTELQKAWR